MAQAGKRSSRIGAAIVLVAVGALGGWAGGRQSTPPASNAAAQPLVTATVARRDLNASVLATGVIRPRVGAEVAVGSRISGVVRRLHVTVGERVVAGQLLAELDRQEAEAALERAEAQLASAQAEFAFATRELTRTQALSAREFVPAAEVSAAQRLHDGTAARVREATSAVATARVQLGYTEIRAPIAGVVGTVSTQEGETVAASLSAPTFLTIVDLDRLEVWAYVDETDVGLVRTGQRARFSVSTYPDAEINGRIVAVRPTAEVIDNVVTYIARLTIDGRQGLLLRPEMTTTIRIDREGVANALAIPNGALRRDAAGSYVLVRKDDVTARRDVRIGFRGSDFSEVLSGLDVGDVVIVGVNDRCEATPTERQS